MIILIPAFEPDLKLITLVAGLRAADRRLDVLVVDDGSGPDFAPVFEAARSAGATVIGYPRNRGKGQALKTGFDYVARHHPGRGVVCADSDGQHAISDILRVADRVRSASNDGGVPARVPDGSVMVLGERRFDGAVPARSRIGNSVTRALFRLASGTALHDTQTGLRGYPAAMLPWLQSVPGDRYEYELNLLLRAGPAGHRIETIEIATIYLGGNESSHFRPLADSARIYLPLLKFALSGFAAFGIDLAAFIVLGHVLDSLLAAVGGARIISSTVNFVINRNLVFPGGRQTRFLAAGVRYFGLVAALMGCNYALIFLLTHAGVPAVPAKLLTEALLFGVSFALQRRFLSGKAQSGKAHMPGTGSTQERHSNVPDRRKRTARHHLENIA